jgi:hypothetical protein
MTLSFRVSEITSSDLSGLTGLPQDACAALLADAQARYPQAKLSIEPSAAGLGARITLPFGDDLELRPETDFVAIWCFRGGDLHDLHFAFIISESITAWEVAQRYVILGKSRIRILSLTDIRHDLSVALKPVFRRTDRLMWGRLRWRRWTGRGPRQPRTAS